MLQKRVEIWLDWDLDGSFLMLMFYAKEYENVYTHNLYCREEMK